jgi:transposase
VPSKLRKHYKHQVSGYKQWAQLSHAEDYCIYPENISENLSIDEVSLSKGELYTIVTSKKTGVKNKKTLVAIINGTEAKTIQSVLEKISIEHRNQVKEVTLDMARNMGLATLNSFPNCIQVIDRFHVVRLVLDAMQHLRINIRWQVVDAENASIKEAKEKNENYMPELLSNDDTLKELLARSRYLLYKTKEDWTINQEKRATLLFERYPLLEKAYKLTLEFRSIYKLTCKQKAREAFIQWKEKAVISEIKEFNSCINSLEYHLENILNFFTNRTTNANAESFNSKIKNFRANLRGVTDVKFFLFRMEKLFA